MRIELESMALELPNVVGHPNRVPFRGVLTLVDVPSDKPPSGARGHRVMITRAAVERALPSLLGMALDFAPSFDKHDARRKIGVITSAEMKPWRELFEAAGQNPSTLPSGTGPQQLEVTGFIYAKDFPEVVREMRSGGRQVHGMSYEIADARVADMSAAVWTIEQFTFTGAALLRRDKAAYRNTWIELVPAGASALRPSL